MEYSGWKMEKKWDRSTGWDGFLESNSTQKDITSNADWVITRTQLSKFLHNVEIVCND